MKKLILKTIIYIFLILVALEITVRIFHLYTESPQRFIDKYGVEKMTPGNRGYAVTGNRNQDVAEFHINNAGFNSYRDYNPKKEKFEIALIGDSFIEGFHQDYYNSIGKKIENRLKGVEVYEYGYSGYDMANQLQLINAYQEDFELIDEVILYMNYKNDLKRAEYKPNTEQIAMFRSPLFQIRDHIKLLAYGSKIGILEPLKNLVTGKAFSNQKQGFKTNVIETKTPAEIMKRDQRYLDNFRNLVRLYGYDKSKTTLLLDSTKTSPTFLDYCNANGFKYIDFSTSFKKTTKATTLIYDWHWNDHGRELIAQVISEYIKNKNKNFVAFPIGNKH
ncbi:hypothetical protein K8352_10610 [Flavobacteriaceae bacterium F89]|uniref:SGNH/GDSL hydrolase family protein n=1 Tax=Cerina litoralis TaxID=2874477 RepID=A0AAE3EVC0_9FLAO|nr:SGNH/GDSL hydrolase family protein [Cerina litoralis]MCG2461200.1 hypothetical protein [Cerina litoralis]